MRVIRRLAIALTLYALPVLLVLGTVGWFGLRVARGIDPPIVAPASSAMEPKVREGDLVILQPSRPGTLVVGDIAALRDDEGEIVVRRVAARDQRGTTFDYRFVANNRRGASDLVASDREVIGELQLRIPLIGYPLILFQTVAGKVLYLSLVALGIIIRRGTPEPSDAPKEVSYGGDDRPATRETAMSITPAELRHVRFGQVRKGYDTEAVDRTLERVADSVEELLHERHELLDRIRALESEVERYREFESTLTQTLTLAERAAEELKAEARMEADRLLAEARAEVAAAPPAATREAATTSAMPDPAFLELLGETRAIRSLLQTLMTQAPGAEDGSPFAPRNQQ